MRNAIGYIKKNNLELNPYSIYKFKFIEDNYTRKISNRSDRIYSTKFRPLNYEYVKSNADMLKGNDKIMLVGEVVLLDEELRERMIKWVEWANSTDDKVHDLI